MVVVLIIAATVVIVVLLLRNRRGHYSPEIQRLYVIMISSRGTFISTLHLFFLCRGQMSAADISAKPNEAYELTKVSEEPTYMSVYQWFNVWKHGQVFHVLLSIHCLQ